MTFCDLGLSDFLTRAVEARSYTAPTEIQRQTIPLILAGEDVIAQARTGTGKTAAFALPMIQRLDALVSKEGRREVLGLVLTPTRELALQVAAFFKAYAQFSPSRLKTLSVIGGEDIVIQLKGLSAGVDVIVATPGRLLELTRMKKINLAALQIFVLDEADKLLNLGFSEELAEVFAVLPAARQSLLFSATLTDKVSALGAKTLKAPTLVTLAMESPTIDAIQQRVIEVNRDRRRALLQQLLKTEPWEQVLVFVGSKQAARNLARKLDRDGFSAEGFHGDLAQAERVQVLRDFKRKNIRVLVATDIAARGIDLQKLSCVVNYDLPRSPLDYVHRIGRTGRAGEAGVAISLIDHDSRAHFRTIEKKSNIALLREQIEGFELVGEPSTKPKKTPVKGKRRSKKDKLRAQALAESRRGD